MYAFYTITPSLQQPKRNTCKKPSQNMLLRVCGFDQPPPTPPTDIIISLLVSCSYIYDRDGVELHVLRNHIQPLALEFLPYHFLLASVGQAGYLKYQDTSTGDLVSEHRTKLGSCNVIRQNPWNAVLCLGHSNGYVTMWTPNMSLPVVKMLCHRGPGKPATLRPGQTSCAFTSTL